MNYYPFHIGDYLSATRHLSWEEDAAYRRLLDTYYTTEKPLPIELRAVCRLVLATSDSQREAVRVVLEEFFEKSDSGWVNRRADTEIAAMRDKQKKQREKANKRWHKPNPVSGNADGGKNANASTADDGVAALPQHNKGDAVASKIAADAVPPTPTPTPTPIDDPYGSSPCAARADDDAPASPGEWIEIFAAEHGVEVDHRSLHDRKKFMPLAAGWVAAGVTVGQMRQACAEARAKATEPIAWLPAYADRVLATLQAPPRQQAAAAETFRERDERLAREKMAAFLPGIAAKGPAATQAARNVIDITPSTFPAIGA